MNELPNEIFTTEYCIPSFDFNYLSFELQMTKDLFVYSILWCLSNTNAIWWCKNKRNSLEIKGKVERNKSERVGVHFTLLNKLDSTYAFCKSEWKTITTWAENKIGLTGDNS